MNNNFRKEEVWHRSMNFIDYIYDLTENFKEYERFRLTMQLRWAATSIALNIAEACAMVDEQCYLDLLNEANKAAVNAIDCVEQAGHLNYINQDIVDFLVSQCGEMASMIVGMKYRVKITNC